jgi:nitrite reductase (NO-forming)
MESQENMPSSTNNSNSNDSGQFQRTGSLNKPASAGTVAFPWHRLAILIWAVIACLTGLMTAFARIGLSPFAQSPELVSVHGALMVFGFLGTAIGMERGVAYHAGSADHPRWGLIAPLLGALGVVSVFILALIPSLPSWWPAIPGAFWAASMFELSAVYIGIWSWQNSVTLIIQMMGSLTGALGMILYACSVPALRLAPMWMVFLVLTIIGERLELARVSFTGKFVENTLITAAATSVIGAILILIISEVGYVILGLSFLVLLITMLSHDIARHTFKLPGMTGFMGVAMLCAYTWGIIGSLMWIFLPQTDLFSQRSAFALVCFDLGFTMTMVIAHASIIVPAIIRRPMPFSTLMWIPLVALESGLAIGAIGTVRGSEVIGQAGSVIAILSLLALIIVMVGLNLPAVRQWRANRQVRA